MAVDSARRNCQALFGATGDCRFHHGDGVLGLEQRFELILCNPPFHLGHTVDDFAGRRLLTQCRQALAHGGELVLVANRHLDYGPTLRRSFHRVETLAANRKFTLWRAAQS
jgi:16S rRNA (guanine1207-N2)-methyltransferase/23S rRNA (guanine1835-N2)-methyltransferase